MTQFAATLLIASVPLPPIRLRSRQHFLSGNFCRWNSGEGALKK
jgi:hypothetical protein